MTEIFLDDHIIIVDKPAGLPSQRDKKGRLGVYEMLCKRFRHVGLHHRLDVAARGLIVLGLSRAADQGLARQFQGRSIHRTYKARMLGNPGEGTWKPPIDGKAAITHFRTLEPGMTSLVEVRLETGRTHQIRRHASEAGHPIIGDRRYGGAAGRLDDTLQLLAWQLELVHPVTGSPVIARSQRDL
ncbi:MAG: RluA family pseudouridine synthase [Proteobacteria bacterium]|nr:RluA family pseudouridine synthase [Pseudomonadota bacterium]MCP4919716.1 RluA family pseudouridine synthase [Pseudomonadota bacterium]